jgi:hypothetical protein
MEKRFHFFFQILHEKIDEKSPKSSNDTIVGIIRYRI